MYVHVSLTLYIPSLCHKRYDRVEGPFPLCAGDANAISFLRLLLA